MWSSGVRVSLGPRRAERCVLGLLLLEPGRVVPVDRLSDLLWEDRPPRQARAILSSHVSRLRAVLDPDRDGSRGVQLVAVGDGYLAQVDPANVDVTRFVAMVANAQQAAEPTDRAAQLRDALSLWRGSLLADVATDRLRDRMGTALEELRLHAWENCMAAELAAGRHQTIVTELHGLVAAHPGREAFAGSLMLALYRSGRTAEALEVFRRAVEYAAETFGLDVGAELTRLRLAILRSDPQLEPSAPVATATPWRLPSPLPDFVGRAAERKLIDQHVSEMLDAGRAPMVAISGLPGMGKTALAITAAYAFRDRFTSGQLYADLHGHDAPLDPVRVLSRFLRELGIPGTEVPDDADEAAALYRTLLSQQPHIVLLDNAAGMSQVRPLLPPPSCPLLVTSRPTLADLDGARFIRLGPWHREESLRLFASVLGDAWPVEHDDAVATIVDRCGHLPLAVRIIAARCQASGISLPRVAQDLSGSALDQLTGDERSVRASLLSAYASLSERERELLRGLAVTTADAFPAWVADAVLDSDAGQMTLRRLVRFSLVETSGVDALGQSRYRLHDLVRAFAAEQSGPADVLRRVADAWNTLADEADALLVLAGSYRVNPATAGRAAYTDVHRTDPHGWFTVEIATLLDLADRAIAGDLPYYAWSLIWNSEAHLRRDARPRDIITLSERALTVAERAADQRGIACMGLSLAAARLIVDDLGEAERRALAALAAAEACDDAWLQAEVLGVLAQVHSSLGRTSEQRAALTRAVGLHGQAGDKASMGAKMVQLADVALLTGDYATAVDYFDRGLHALREAGATDLLARGLRRYALSRLNTGDVDGCVELLRESLSFIGDDEPTGQLCLRTELGMALAERDDFTAARAETDSAVSLIDRVDLPLYAAYARMGHGVVLARMGQAAEALDLLTTVAPSLQAAPLWRLTCLTQIGRLQAQLGRPDLARAILTEVAAEAEAMQAVSVAEQARRFLRDL